MRSDIQGFRITIETLNDGVVVASQMRMQEKSLNAMGTLAALLVDSNTEPVHQIKWLLQEMYDHYEFGMDANTYDKSSALACIEILKNVFHL